jgi:hypothetical protein
LLKKIKPFLTGSTINLGKSTRRARKRKRKRKKNSYKRAFSEGKDEFNFCYRF